MPALFALRYATRLSSGALPVFLAFVLAAPQSYASVVVETVEKNFGADRAGLAVGDVIESWSRHDERGEASGNLQSVFDLMDVETEQAPHGTVTLRGQRDGKQRDWAPPAAAWKIKVRPLLFGAALTRFDEARKLELAAKPLEAAPRWQALAAETNGGDAYYFPQRAAEGLAKARLWQDCDDVFQAAVSRAESDEPAVLVWLLRSWADTFTKRNDPVNAEKYYQQALSQSHGTEDLKTAATLYSLGDAADQRGDLAGAERWHEQALELRRKLVPDSLVFAYSLNRLGVTAWKRGDLNTAEDYLRQAQKVFDRLAPQGTEAAGVLNNLGIIAWNRGDLGQAGEYYRESLKRWEAMSPGSLDVSRCLDNLGIVAMSGGDFGKSEEYHREALKIRRKLEPESLDVARTLNNLGLAVWFRGKSHEAEQYYGESLRIKEKLAPESLEVAMVLHNLAEVAVDRRDLNQAEAYLQRSLALKERLAPGSSTVATSLSTLGTVALRRGDTAEAKRYYDRAAAIRERVSPESVELASVLADLGTVAMRQGRFSDARSLFERAISIVETQRGRLPSTEARAFLLAKYQGAYTGLLRANVALQDLPAAFYACERARARSLLDLLAAAHVDVREGIDPALAERERALQGDLNAKARQQTRLLAGKHSEQDAMALTNDVAALSAKFDDVEATIRAASPHYAALTQPQPLGLEAIQKQVLDDGALLLEYSLGEESSYVFAVTSTSIHCYRLPSRAVIERLARSVYELAYSRSRSEPGDSSVEKQAQIDYPKIAARLSRMILAPVAGRLGRKRLLIVADGALQQIPFATLLDPDATTPRALLAAHEIVNVPSASVLAAQRCDLAGREPADRDIAIFADPVFEPTDERVKPGLKPAPGTRGASASRKVAIGSRQIDTARTAIPRLRYSRQEAAAILAVAPRQHGLYALDFDATKARTTGPEIARFRIVHFATHAMLDNDHPELSGIVLSLVNRQGKEIDGFLRLNEIYNLRLKADLVVLSGCETALGQQVEGEGLIGLTRGFLYAGATRVVASLWKVDDSVTAKLMGRFYEAMLREKKSPAAALREAQLEMSRDPQWHDPYYWAGFQLQGEWK